MVKVLIHKVGGSIYPNFEYFNSKINLLNKYLGKYLVNLEICFKNNRIRVVQNHIEGDDIFKVINTNRKIKDYNNFIIQLERMYKETKILPDLFNDNNIIVTKSGEIRIIDIWPLFFKERVVAGDLNIESFNENIEKYKTLVGRRVNVK